MRNASCQPANGFEPLQLLDFLFQAFAFSPLLCFMKLPVNGGKQARQIVLHDIVLSALFQRGHGRFFPDGAGDKNKREFQTFCPQQFQRLRSREVRHGVIADDQVPLLLSQGRLHTGRAIHSFICHFIAAPAQLPNQQRGVVFRIFHHEQVKGQAHLTILVSGAGSFKINQ